MTHHPPSDGLPLVAQVQVNELASRMGEGFRHGRPSSYAGGLSLGLLSVLALAMALWLLARLAAGASGRPGAIEGPRRLFFRLCRAHHLRWSDGWLLWRLARALRLDSPVRLFLEPQRLDATSLPARFQQQAARLRAIRGRLFAGLDRSSA
jgi:hypothetical protein